MRLDGTIEKTDTVHLQTVSVFCCVGVDVLRFFRGFFQCAG